MRNLAQCSIGFAIFALILISGIPEAVHAQGSMVMTLEANRGDLDTRTNRLLDQVIEPTIEGLSVQEALRTIAAELDLSLIYRNNLLPEDKLVTLERKPYTLYDALWATLEDTGLRYAISGIGQLVILPMEETPTLSSATVHMPETAAVQQTVTGTVTDADTGEPLIGVNIVVRGTTIGTTTDLDGEYSLQVPTLEETLVFSYIGYELIEQIIDGRVQINVAMQPVAIMGQDLVVVGYGVQRRETLSGSVSSISGDVIANRTATNIMTTLQGTIPNLTITIPNTGGEPGASQNVNIRGFESISGGSPLVIIDGVEGQLDNVNPDDVESISVLKDATATAIYGSRAAFGVIDITTKRGRDQGGKVNFSYSSNISFDSPTNLPNMVDAVRYMETMNLAAVNAGQSPIHSQAQIERTREWMQNPGSIPGTVLNQNNEYFPAWDFGNANVDYFDEFFKNTAMRQQHNLSVRGGSATARYFLSAGVFDQGSQMNYGDHSFQRYTVTANVDATITSWLDIRMDNRYIRRNRDFPTQYVGTGIFYHQIARRQPQVPVLDPNGNLLDESMLQMDGGGRNLFQGNQLINTAAAIVRPTRNWQINLNVSFRQNYEHTTDHRKTIYRTLADGVRHVPVNNTFPNHYSTSFYHDYYNTNNIYTSYDLNIGNHFTRFIGGFQSEFFRDSGLDGMRRELITEFVPSLSTAIGDDSVNDRKAHWSTTSYFGRMNYSYNEKYMIEFVGRLNGSSRFPKDGRWGFFPAVSIGYNLAREDFWTDRLGDVVNEFKLRASYGSNGNQDVPNYLYLPNMGVNQNFPWLMGSERPVAVSPAGLLSPDITWETVTTTNVGLDAGFLRNRLRVSLDYYIRETKNMFGPAESLPAVLGASVPTTNNADLETKGFEAEVSWNDRVGNVRYNVRATLADNFSTITRYRNETGILNDWYVGSRPGDIWGWHSVGLYQTDEDAANGPDQSFFFGGAWRAGDMEYKDLTGDGKITNGANTIYDPGDRTIIGNSRPRYTYGVRLDLQWHGFDLALFGQGVGKRDLWLGGNYFFGVVGNRWQTSIFEEHMDFWTPDNPGAYYPRPYMTGQHNKNIRPQTRYLQDASYFRLKNVQLGYTLPMRLASMLQLDHARIYFNGENLFYLTNLKTMFDPDATVGSWGPGKTYPLARTLSMGINLQF